MGFFPSCFGRTTFHQLLKLTCVRYTLKTKHVSRKSSMVQYFPLVKPQYGSVTVFLWNKTILVQCYTVKTQYGSVLNHEYQCGSVFYQEIAVWFSALLGKPSMVLFFPRENRIILGFVKYFTMTTQYCSWKHSMVQCLIMKTQYGSVFYHEHPHVFNVVL